MITALLSISFWEFIQDNLWLTVALLVGIIAVIILRKNFNIKP